MKDSEAIRIGKLMSKKTTLEIIGDWDMLIAALETAPEPPVDYIGVQEVLGHPATVVEIFKTWRDWYDGPRAAALAKAKGKP